MSYDEIQVKTTDEKLETMPLIPLRGIVIYPNTIVHFDVGREKSVRALQKAMTSNQTVFLCAQKNADTDLPSAEDFYHVGTVAKVKQMLKTPGDNIRVLVEGLYRAKVDTVLQEVPYFLAAASRISEKADGPRTPDRTALMRTALSLFSEYARKNPSLSADVLAGLEEVESCGRLADMISCHVELKINESQNLLATIDPDQRIGLLIEYLSRELEILSLEDKINHQVKDRMNRNQKEYYLREQMRAIQQELGQDEDVKDDVDKYRERMKELSLPEVVEKKLSKEISNLSRMPASSPEVNVARTYIEWILDLPWNEQDACEIDLIKAQKVLDEDHYGLEKVKERIIEYLAVQALAGTGRGSILCLVGPPGVGKTSVARSVARSIGRKFVHMSLGGVRDEAEIRGHRRTYIGAIPGRIMTEIKECGSKNPVFLFDEVDKIGADYKGDPASALLEVLDPEQNREFVDHYLEVPFDLSGVMFITTANTVDTIPRPLLDRMEVIQLSGYTPQEKFRIASDYLVPKQLKEHGLADYKAGISPEAVQMIIDSYTREAGVRNLEKEIGKICRRFARKVVEARSEADAEGRKVNLKARKYYVTDKNIREYLGKEKYNYDRLLEKNEIGVATGLAWTVVGGETLFIETALMPGSGQILLTGQLGDVMQESARAAVSYIRTKAAELGIEEEFHKTKDLHIHIPEGATPKDGPSAGVTMCTSVISALTGRPVRKDVAMTGEITLRGKILPVGGIKEKMLAAHRMGIHRILLPKENGIDLEELPDTVKKSVSFVLIETVDDAIREALI